MQIQSLRPILKASLQQTERASSFAKTAAHLTDTAAHLTDTAAVASRVDPSKIFSALPSARQELLSQAAKAVTELGETPGRATGALRDALDAGHLLRHRSAGELDALETLLSRGVIDQASSVKVGAGMNGARYRVSISDSTGKVIEAVEKPLAHQGGQEQLAWKLGRELGLDHLLPVTGRRADGAAMIEFLPGENLLRGGAIKDVKSLDTALAASYIDDPVLKLSAREAAHAARTDRQLLQSLDYILANNDRHFGNGLVDAGKGARVRFIDYGHAGNGQNVHGATPLKPSLRELQGTAANQHKVKLDDDTVEFIRKRLTPERIDQIHGEIFAQGAAPSSDRLAAEMNRFAAGIDFREGMKTRLSQILRSGEYEHIGHVENSIGGVVGLDHAANANARLGEARGVGAVRQAFMDAEMF